MEDANLTFSAVDTNDSSIDDPPGFVAPPGYNAILLGGTLLIIVVGLIANAAVLFIVMFEQLQKSPNSPVHTINTYITNLASADFLYIFVSMFWAINNYNQSGWKFGDFGCRGVYFLEFFTLHASAYILTVMTIERYLAIVYPMSSLRFRNIKAARIISACVWISAFLFALPTLFLTKMIYMKLGKSIRAVCYFTLGNSYMTSAAVITFIIPSFLMATVYLKMFTSLYSVIHKEDDLSNGTENSSRQLKNSSRRAAKSVFIIVIVWLVCFLPYWSYHFLYMYFGIHDKKMIFPIITVLLTYLNSMLNPFLYTLMPRRYNVWKRLRARPPPYNHPHVKCFRV